MLFSEVFTDILLLLWEQSMIVKRPVSQNRPEMCEGCTQLQRQTSELQRQLLLAKAEKDEALKLKEEVNVTL